MSCEYCSDYWKSDHKTLNEYVDVWDGEIEIDYDETICGESVFYKARIKINFCPMCGKPLTEPEPLTLEQLREMAGKPVYAQSVLSPGEGHWCVLDRIYGRDEGIHIVAVYGVNMTLETSDYDKTWLAYARKPKEGE